MNNDAVNYSNLANLLKVLAHPLRLCIVRGLIANGGCNVTHMHECLETPQSTVSQHLQKLRSAGIIHGVRNGLEVNYRVCDARVIAILHILFSDESDTL